MTRTFRVLGLAASLAVPAALTAQSADKAVSFGVSGGLSLPMGDLGDVVESGYAIAGHVYFKPAGITALRFRGDVSYDRWSAKDGFTGNRVDANLRALGVVANAIFDVSSSSASTVKPYLLGGIGLFNAEATASAGNFSRSDSDTNLGIQVGGGLTFQLSGFSTFLEAKYVNAFSEGDNTNWIPITFGVRF